MVKRSIFDRGDIVRLCLNPTAGREIQGNYRPCLVLSPRPFNRLGMTLIAPITQGGNFARVKGFALPLMGSGTETQGVVIISGIRMVDLVPRKATKVDVAPPEIVDEALAILTAILE